MAEDARIRKTKAKLAHAFVELMKERPFRDITPAMICEKAGVNRSTFYRNYKNTTQLKEEMEQKILDSVSWRGKRLEDVISKQSILGQLQFLQEKADIFGVLGSKCFGTGVFEKITHRLLLCTRENYPRYANRVSREEFERECDFYVTAMVGTIYMWYRNGMKDDKEILAEYISGKMQEGFRKFI